MTTPGRCAATMRRVTSWAHTNVPFKLVPSTASHSSSVISKNGARAWKNARVIHQDINGTKVAFRRGHQLPGGLGLRDIGLEQGTASPHRGDLRGHGGSSGLVIQEVERYIGALLGKTKGNGPSNALLGASHQDDLVGTAHGVGLSG